MPGWNEVTEFSDLWLLLFTRATPGTPASIYIIQIYSGIICGRVLNGELYTCKLYKLINLCRSTGCFVKLHFINFTKQPVDQHRLINLYNLHIYMPNQMDWMLDNACISSTFCSV